MLFFNDRYKFFSTDRQTGRSPDKIFQMTIKSNKLVSTPKKRKRIVIPFRSAIKWLVRLRRSPQAIAGGFALGTFIAFTPTIGFQIALVLFLATFLNFNRPAAISSVWITNAATMAPVYTFNYWVGSFIWAGPDVSEVYQTFAAITLQLLKMDFWQIQRQFRTVLDLGSDILVPLVIGSLIVGICAAVFVYLLAISLLYMLLSARAKKHRLDDRTWKH